MRNMDDFMSYLFTDEKEDVLLGTNKVCPLCKNKLEVNQNIYDNMIYICNNCNIKLNKNLTEYEEINHRHKRR